MVLKQDKKIIYDFNAKLKQQGDCPWLLSSSSETLATTSGILSYMWRAEKKLFSVLKRSATCRSSELGRPWINSSKVHATFSAVSEH